jgi:PAS domain S-box-containing protein
MVAADGKVVWVRDLITVVVEADRATRFRGVMFDVTKRKLAEAAMRERASLLNLTHDTIFVRDMQDVITYWNRGAEELYGWKAEEALGKVTHQLMRTAFPAPLEQIQAELLSAGRWEGELVHTKADGTQVVVASRWSLQRDEQDRPVAILETNNDISERKRAEEALRRQANLLEQTHDAILVWELPGTIRYWNRGAEQLYGFSREETVGRVSHDLLRTEHPMATKLFEPLIERYGSWTGELTHTRRDGRKIVVESRHVLMRDADGRQLVLETNRDVSERKQAEYLTGQVFESTPDGIAIIGREFTYQRVNPVYERIWGVPATKMIGMHLADVLGMEAFELRAKPNLERCFAGEEEVSYAEWLVTAIGRRYIVVSYSPLRPESERVAAALVILRDLTEHMLASEGLRQAQAELAHVNRVTTMGELTASLAHEVNQPIAAAVTNANTCLRWLANSTPNVEEARQAVMRIVKDSTRAADIISRIRTLFKKGALQPELVDVNELIREMVVLLRTEVTRYCISLRFELAEDLPMVMTDRVQLQQVFMNLMLNGIEAMKDKPNSANQLTICSERREDGQLLISISDTGVGLPPQADKIFNAFFTTKAQGTGMGLSISRSIIESQGGHLWAANNSGSGAVFHFTLPTKEASE